MRPRNVVVDWSALVAILFAAVTGAVLGAQSCQSHRCAEQCPASFEVQLDSCRCLP